MAAEIESVFKAGSKSVLDFLRSGGQACYIPAYQRPYAWSNENIERLVEDATQGLNSLLSWPDSVTFLGTIIAIHDTSYKTIKPAFHGQVPDKVMTVIDGQQRLTSLTIINCIIHNELTKYAAKLKTANSPEFEWIKARVASHVGDLAQTIYLDKYTGDSELRYYPKMIRAMDDTWSTRKGEATYRSPIGRFLHAYIAHIHGGTGAFKYRAANPDGSVLEGHKKFLDNFQSLGKRLRGIAQDKEVEFPSIGALLHAKPLMEALVNQQAPDSVVDFVGGADTQQHFATFTEALRLLIFSSFLNKRTALTVVTTTEEDYAFDMFEALNTTGEPLTAYETFKPKVIDAEGLSHYETSPSYEHMAAIDSYLNDYPKAEQRQKATSDLLIPFALAEEGMKLGKKLNEQRVFLRRSYDGIEKIEAKRDFTRHLAELSAFLKHAWPADRAQKPSLFPLKDADTDLAVLCLDVLKQMNHSVVIAPIFRFYMRAVAEDDEQRRALAASELTGAILAVTAFSIMWRATRIGTENIDAVYRDLMEKGIDGSGGQSSKLVLPLKRRHQGGAVTLLGLKQALWHKLQHAKAGGISDQSVWRAKVQSTPVYAQSSIVAKFLLFAASHDAVEDAASPGLIEAGKKNTLPLLNIDRWRDETNFSVEHVAPQTKSAAWDDDLYENSAYETVGNLTLLPAEVNSLVGNRSWINKKAIFAVFATVDHQSHAAALAAAKAQGLSFSATTEQMMDAAGHLPMTRAIVAYPGKWDLGFVRQRSGRIADLVWERLTEWLRPPSGSELPVSP